MEPRLFAVYLGGKADGCNIELHDVVFVVGTCIEETYPLLAKKWFGNMDGFHIDAYVHLKNIDGYEIELSKTQVTSSKKLYFINLGAYKPHEFTEYHQSGFYVTEDAPEAVQRAKSELCQGLQVIHKDDVVLLDHVKGGFDVDDILEIGNVDDYFISLRPSSSQERPLPIAEYIRLDTLLLQGTS